MNARGGGEWKNYWGNLHGILRLNVEIQLPGCFDCEFLRRPLLFFSPFSRLFRFYYLIIFLLFF